MDVIFNAPNAAFCRFYGANELILNWWLICLLLFSGNFDTIIAK